MTVEQQLQVVTKELVGLWRFRIKGRKPKWCGTYHIEGHYYDTGGYDTVGEVLARVIKSTNAHILGRKK